MLEAPFLELQFYVADQLDETLAILAPGTTLEEDPSAIAIPGIVGLGSAPEELARTGSVVVLRTEGDAFCGTARKATAQLKRLGRIVYRRFLEVSELVPCVYAAILVEYSLEEPTALRADARSLAFRNFYVAHAKVRPGTLDAAVRLAGDNAYVKTLERGTYVSMSAEFNPEARRITSAESQERSVEIAKVIARGVR